MLILRQRGLRLLGKMPKIGPANCLETRPVRKEWGASGLEERSQIGARLE